MKLSGHGKEKMPAPRVPVLQQDHWISSVPGDMEIYLWLELLD